jgi:predicted small lipoprotein YifL
MSKKRITICCLSALIILWALAGCGRKGGLYLPENVKSDNEKTQFTQAPGDE